MPPEVIVTVLAVVAGLAATTSPTVVPRRWGWVLAGTGAENTDLARPA